MTQCFLQMPERLTPKRRILFVLGLPWGTGVILAVEVADLAFFLSAAILFLLPSALCGGRILHSSFSSQVLTTHTPDLLANAPHPEFPFRASYPVSFLLVQPSCNMLGPHGAANPLSPSRSSHPSACPGSPFSLPRLDSMVCLYDCPENTYTSSDLLASCLAIPNAFKACFHLLCSCTQVAQVCPKPCGRTETAPFNS